MSNFDTSSSIQTTFRTASIQSITIVMLTKRQHSADSSDTIFCFDLFSTDTVYIFKVLLLFVILLKLFVVQNSHTSYYF